MLFFPNHNEPFTREKTWAMDAMSKIEPAGHERLETTIRTTERRDFQIMQPNERTTTAGGTE